jgi:hypothetical protein
MDQINGYQRKANRFLDKYGIIIHAELSVEEERCPLWCDGSHIHGDHYTTWIMDKTGKREHFHFDFWNSLTAKEDGNRPTNYDILAGIACDLQYQDDALDDDEVRIRVNAQKKKIESFFTEEELKDLKEIT